MAFAQEDAGPPDEPARLAEEIRARVESIERTRREHLAARDELQAEIARVEAGITELAARRDQGTDATATLRTQVEQAEAAIGKARADADARLALLDGLAAAARPVAEDLARRIRSGIPHRREERAKAFEEIAALLATDGDWEQRAEGVRRFLAAAGQELQLAATREVKSETVPVAEGVRKPAYVARFGLVAEFFVTEDGLQAGIAAREEGRAWLVLDDPDRVARLTAVLDCLRRRRQPEILALPLVPEARS